MSLQSLEADREVDSFEGTGEWYYGTPPDHERIFSVSSTGVGASTGDRIGFSRYSGGRPGLGTYDFKIHREAWREENATLGGQYWRTLPDGRREYYVVESGTLVVTKSTASEVRGLVDFTAVRFRVGSEGFGVGSLPHPVPAHLPRLEVEGEFVATYSLAVTTPHVP